MPAMLLLFIIAATMPLRCYAARLLASATAQMRHYAFAAPRVYVYALRAILIEGQK